jgi:medium-chain acyl-[acyl-carrier-protein] hydrolase
MNLNDPSQLITVTRYPVTSADTDMEARLRVGGLVGYLVLSAIRSADQLGFGFDFLREQKLFWVLNRITIEIERPLRWYEEAVVETWPKDLEKILYLRDYRVSDQDGKTVARATSGWTSIDTETHRPRLINEIDLPLFTRLKERHGIEGLPERIGAVPEGEQSELLTTYFDLDLNRHVTSSRYVDWMMDTFPVGFHQARYPKRISVNYMKETAAGTLIRITRKQTDNGDYLFEGVHKETGKVAFRGVIHF